MKSKSNFRTKTFSISFRLIIASIILFISLGTTVVYQYLHPEEIYVQKTESCNPEMTLVRAAGSKFTHPLLLADLVNESPDLLNLKTRVMNYISQEAATGSASSVSVYVRTIDNGEWFAINGSEKYVAASVIKVTLMIPYLLEADAKPEILKQKLYFEKHQPGAFEENIKAEMMTENRYYTIDELLNRMIRNSDNDAALLLAKNLNFNVYKKFFNDIGLAEPKLFNDEYYLDVTDAAKFFRVIYNSSYVGRRMSEYALNILTQCEFKNGLVSGVDAGIAVAHKFGERTLKNGNKELHDIGIIYLESQPYIVSIMTRGNDFEKLKTIISTISRIVFDEMKVRPATSQKNA